MLVPFQIHPSITRALAAVLPTTRQSNNMNLSGMIYCVDIKHRQKCCQWANKTVKVCDYWGWAVQL